ncbi:MAG: DEAD-box ATP-dependent RNA helicase CshA [Deltaproteobacteria bacterium ADurb.Bin510]|nr:MAG: DEAD-box ATP-dependent RNA helicase CshA [Deltaproteobacteria bacterium ADurb.Bin510]
MLDEADEMLNMGFIEEIEAILEYAPKERRTLLFSATMPKQVLTIAKRYMGAYETIAIERQMTGLTDQIYFEVYEQDKFEALCRIIDMEPEFYGLVFCRTRVDTSEIAQKLEARGYDAEAIHGDITQAQRERIMQRFRDKRANILVATDVAARGIDVNNLSHVINYALPPDPESYVHRIGRTGRAGKQGTAITFVTPREYRTLHFIRKAAGAEIRKGKLPKVDDVIMAKQARIKAEVENNLQASGSELYATLASELLSHQDAVDVLAACLKLAFKDELEVGTYREIKEVGQAQASSPDLKGHTRLLMASGHNQGVSPKKLIRFITERTGIPEKRIGDIRIFDDHTFITVPFSEAETILKRCGTQDGKPLITMARPDQRPQSNHRPYAKPGYAKPVYAKGGEGKFGYAKGGDGKPGYKKTEGVKPGSKKSGEVKAWEPVKRPRKTDH